MLQPAATPRTQAEEILSREIATLTALENARRPFAHVTGWLHPFEGFILMRLASATPAMPPGAVAEVGSFKGLSTCWLATGLKIAKARGGPPTDPKFAKVYAIDHFTGSPEHQKGGKFEDADILAHGSTLPRFRENVAKAGLAEFVEPIQAGSREAATAWSAGPIRVLFIDGDHSYEATREDFELWKDRIVPGGYVCFHDVNTWEGVTRFVGELMKNPASGFVNVLAAGTLFVFRRVA